MRSSTIRRAVRTGVVSATVLVACTAIGVSAQSLSETHGQHIYHAVRVDTPPSIDGDLSDAAWQRANVIGQLVQQVPVVAGRLVPQSRALQTKLTYRWYW